ncbi:MAG TPA: M4 family metallopeptidase [Anaerolineales bacterium]|nr:M4 family metallopeptidase [Anaerolineales bacterium]
MHAHNSILCILPPHVLDQIIQNGSPEQRNLAQQTVTASRLIRDQRNAARLGGATRRVVRRGEMAATANKQRTIYDAQHGSTLPGTKVRGEGDPDSSDVSVNEAYDGSGTTFDLYYNIYGRNSVDNNGLKLDSSVHYQVGYDNAFWNGNQMVYGDGDENLPANQRLFNRFTIAIDVIGHELTHGVTQYEANLDYANQPGALNESFSDVFGSLVKQYHLQQTADQADWIIGQGLLTANVKGVGLRSMKAPGTAYDDPVLGKDPQPANMSSYVNTSQDEGGVHINSGIPNHAFYVVATEIGGFAWEKAGMIWYKALTDKLTSSSNFQDAANLTFQAATELYGSGSLEETAVKTGWSEVGITVGDVPPVTPPSGDGCLTATLRAMGFLGSQPARK